MGFTLYPEHPSPPPPPQHVCPAGAPAAPAAEQVGNTSRGSPVLRCLLGLGGVSVAEFRKVPSPPGVLNVPFSAAGFSPTSQDTRASYRQVVRERRPRWAWEGGPLWRGGDEGQTGAPFFNSLRKRHPASHHGHARLHSRHRPATGLPVLHSRQHCCVWTC